MSPSLTPVTISVPIVARFFKDADIVEPENESAGGVWPFENDSKSSTPTVWPNAVVESKEHSISARRWSWYQESDDDQQYEISHGVLFVHEQGGV